MRHYWMIFICIAILGILTLVGCSGEPVATPLQPTPTANPVSTKVAASPVPVQSPTVTPALSITPTLVLPVLAGTPAPLPQEPIIADNVDQIKPLAIWGRGQVKKVAYSPDGQLLAIGTTAGVWLHDAKTLELRRFMLTDEELITLAFLSDSQLIAQVGGKTINRWEVGTGNLVGSWQIDVELLERVAFAPDGTKLAANLRRGGGQVGIWDISSGQLLYTLDSKPDAERVVYILAFSPDGARLASAMTPNPDKPQLSATLNNAIEMWDVEAGTLAHTLSLPDRSEISTLTFSPDSKLLASSHGKDIRLWEIETGTLLHTLQGHTATVAGEGGLSFSPHSQRLISVGFDDTLRLWSVDEGKLLQTLTKPGLGARYLAFSADSSTLITATEKEYANYRIYLWNTSTGAALGEIEEYADGTADVAVSSDGTLYTGHLHNQGIRRWNLQTGQAIDDFPARTTFGTQLALSANGQILAASEPDPSTVSIWDTATGQSLQTLQDYTLSGGSLALSPDGALVASSESSVTYIHDVQTGQQLQRLIGDQGRVAITDLAFSPDGLKLASSGQNIHLFEVKTGEHLFIKGIGALAFSPDGTMIATNDPEGRIVLWNSETGELLRPLTGPQSWGASLAFSTDGRILASVAEGHAVYLWEVETGRLLRVLEGIPLVEKVTFLPNSAMLLSISPRDGTVRFWGIPSQ